MVEHANASNRTLEAGPETPWFRSLIDGAADAIIGKTLDGIVVSWNPAAERLFGYSAGEIIDRPVSMLADPDRPREMDELLATLREGRAIERFETTRRRKDGLIVPVSLTISPVHDGRGRLIGASKIARDITERRRREDTVRLHSADADHRLKNLLTLVLAILRRTGGDTVADYRAAAVGRIGALARTNAVIGDGGDGPADLAVVVGQALDGFRSLGERIVTDGPPVALTPAAAQALAMALYELGTNAAKHGALSATAGTARVSWTPGPDGLVLRWIERDGPPAAPPVRHGLGFAVLRAGIEHQLGGRIETEWAPEGLACTIRLPVRHLAGADPGQGGPINAGSGVSRS